MKLERALRVSVLACVVAFHACSGSDDVQTTPPPTPGGGAGNGGNTTFGALAIEAVGSRPFSHRRSPRQTYEMFFDFRVRGDGVPLDADQFNVTLLLNGSQLDSESLLSADQVGGDMLLSMVLDGSYSMVADHNPSAFRPMLDAARRAYDTIYQSWQESRGTDFFFTWVWFNEFIFDPFRPQDFRADNLLRVPEPNRGSFTRLLGAVRFMAERHVSEFDAGRAADVIDRHVMIVFTDGKDNRSRAIYQRRDQFQREPFPHWEVLPQDPTDSAANIQSAVLDARPGLNLAVYAIGMGDGGPTGSIDPDEVRAIANLGAGGRAVFGSRAQLDTLFERITKEISGIQSLGAVLPAAPDAGSDNVLTVRVTAPGEDGLLKADLEFPFNAK